MGPDSGAYKFVFVLHLLAVIIGFGSMSLASAYAARARRRGGREGLAVAEVVLDVFEHISQWFIYAVPVLGIILVLMSDDKIKFSQSWVGISLALYIVALVVLLVLHLPNVRRINAVAAQANAGGTAPAGGRPPQAAELEGMAKKAAMYDGIINLLWIVVVFLMVYKPGA
ncbi:MAG: DUF2269 family protein [Acidimicrobiales bacterium]